MASNILSSMLQHIGRKWGSITAIGQSSRTLFLTQPALAEPPKKKRRLDPGVQKVRVERKIRKLEREINRIEHQPKQAIPLAEYNLQPAQIRDLKSDASKRDISDTELERIDGEFKIACKLWSVYRLNQAIMEQRSIRNITRSQDRALRVLKILSKELYDKAVIQNEDQLLPFYNLDMVKDTPPDPSYTPPDGYVKDVTKEWSM